MLLVNLLVHLKRPAQALLEAERGLASHPNLGELLTAVVTLTERVKGFDKAEALALDAQRTKNPRAARELASLYERNKRYEQAIKVYRDLAKTEPQALMELSQLQDQMGKLDDALASIRKLCDSEPYNVNALGRIGILEGRLGQLEASKRTFERLLALEPDSLWALNNLAMLLADVPGETQRAVDLARRAYVLAREDVRIADTLGWALVKNKSKADRREALQLLERSADAMRSAEANYHYGAALAASDRYAEAKVALEKALRPEADSPWSLEARQLRDEALRHLAEASSIPAHP